MFDDDLLKLINQCHLKYVKKGIVDSLSYQNDFYLTFVITKL